MHAFVDIADWIARGDTQVAAAAFGFTQGVFQPTHAAAHHQSFELATHDHLQMVGPALQGERAGAIAKSLGDPVVADIAAIDDQGDILPGAIDRFCDLPQWQVATREVGQDQIRRLAFQQVFEFGLIARTRWADGNAAIAQHADDLFGLIGRILDQQQLDHVVWLGHGCRAVRGVRRAPMAALRETVKTQTCTGFIRLFPYSV